MNTIPPHPAVATIARNHQAAFLIAEYELTTETLIRNEESGERRAAFFLTLAGAAGAVLAFAFGGEKPILDRSQIAPALVVTGAILLALGLMTTRRLVERLISTDRLSFALRDLRRLFISREEAALAPNAFFRPYDTLKRRPLGIWSVGRGGWLESVAFVNAILFGVIAAAAVRWQWPQTRWWPVATIGAAFVMWTAQVLSAAALVDGELAERRDRDAKALRESDASRRGNV